MRGNTNIQTFGSKIMNLAKEIRKDNPNLKWNQCVKKAAEQLKQK